MLRDEEEDLCGAALVLCGAALVRCRAALVRYRADEVHSRATQVRGGSAGVGDGVRDLRGVTGRVAGGDEAVEHHEDPAPRGAPPVVGWSLD